MLLVLLDFFISAGPECREEYGVQCTVQVQRQASMIACYAVAAGCSRVTARHPACWMFAPSAVTVQYSQQGPTGPAGKYHWGGKMQSNRAGEREREFSMNFKHSNGVVFTSVKLFQVQIRNEKYLYKVAIYIFRNNSNPLSMPTLKPRIINKNWKCG